MSDAESIIQVLRRVEWRRRASRAQRDAAAGLSLVLAVMIALRIWTLLHPLPPFSVSIIVAASLLLLVWRVARALRLKEKLADAAVAIDRTAGLRDEMRTAFWFINNPRSSEWVAGQLERAAARAREIDVDRVCAAPVPRTIYVAGAMLVILLALGFVKPPVAASSLERNRAAAASGARDAAQSAERIRSGLQEIAKALRRSSQTAPIAEAIEREHLDIAADELRDISAEVGLGSGIDQEVLQSFRQAAANDESGLKVLSNTLGELAKAMEGNDVAAAQELAEEAAQELERLEGEILPRESGDEPQRSGDVEAPPGGGDSSQAQQPDEGSASTNNSAGAGGFGRGRQQGVREGAAVSLEVKLEQERLENQESAAQGASTLKVQDATKREQSTRNYQDVASELTPAQRDVLNRAKIPWEYRPLIKSYFEAIHGPQR